MTSPGAGCLVQASEVVLQSKLFLTPTGKAKYTVASKFLADQTTKGMGSGEDRRSHSYMELPATFLPRMLLKWLKRFWTGQTYLVVVRQDGRRKTRVAGSGYERAFQILPWEGARAKAAHCLPGLGGKGLNKNVKRNHSDFIDSDLK